jgi:hypothetical protein
VQFRNEVVDSGIVFGIVPKGPYEYSKQITHIPTPQNYSSLEFGNSCQGLILLQNQFECASGLTTSTEKCDAPAGGYMKI